MQRLINFTNYATFYTQLLQKPLLTKKIMIFTVFQNVRLMLLSVLLCSSPVYANKKICIIIPAYNEEKRIKHTVDEYEKYFATKTDKTTFLIVANNCSDNTVGVVKSLQKEYDNIELINLIPGGKGFAIKQGFLHAQDQDFDLIGFVDADLSTKPQYFYDLIIACDNTDGAIASRYAQSANVWPKRPFWRKVGGKFYNWMLRKKMNLPYKDTQCGAKIFTTDTVKKVAHRMTEKGWSWDLEFLYLCKLEGKKIKEVPTTWSDQPGSHLSLSSSLVKEFLDCPNRIKARHAAYKKELCQQEKALKKAKLLAKKQNKLAQKQSLKQNKPA